MSVEENIAEEAKVEPEAVSEEGGTATAEEIEAAFEELPEDTEILQKELLEARRKADENWAQLLAAKAETDNLRKRNERDVEKARKYALENFVKELLPVRDSLELGLQAAEAEGADVEKVREGMDLTLKMMETAMGKFAVDQVNPEGEAFNPDLHQAMSMVEKDDVPANTVVTVMQKGYTLNDRVVRPAMVMVSKKS